MSLALRFAIALMKWGNKSTRFGGQDCYTEAFVRPAENEISIATRREFEDGGGFFRVFEDQLRVEDLAGKDVLDLGCGHGGRTAYYVIHGKPKSIVGLEINVPRISVARSSARMLCGDEDMFFAAGFGESMPFLEASFDSIISYDVFEHVRDLARVLDECHRVLRPGGRLFALFPPYYGPRAHHLDFVTTIPFLHHVFSPGVLVDAANHILKERPELRDEPLPAPARSYNGRTVLPRLNGTTEREFHSIVGKMHFKSKEITLVPFASGPGGRLKKSVRAFCRAMLRMPLPFTRDIFVGTIRSILEKP